MPGVKTSLDGDVPEEVACARCAQVNMPGHICAVVVTTLVLEGWSSKLDPKHSVLEQARPGAAPPAGTAAGPPAGHCLLEAADTGSPFALHGRATALPSLSFVEVFA